MPAQHQNHSFLLQAMIYWFYSIVLLGILQSEIFLVLTVHKRQIKRFHFCMNSWMRLLATYYYQDILYNLLIGNLNMYSVGKVYSVKYLNAFPEHIRDHKYKC